MISLSKRAKPVILVQNEKKWTSDLMAYVNSGQDVPAHVKGKYRHPEIKNEIIKETNQKCVYCESKVLHIDHGDIEHIIPKSKEPEKTFVWENLTLGCSKCNLNKSDYYNPALPLLNPYTDSPEEKVRFAGPLCIALGSESAVITILKLKLNRPELYERRQEHLNKIIPLIRQYEVANDDVLRKLVLEDLIRLTDSDQEYSSMVKQVLEQLAVTA